MTVGDVSEAQYMTALITAYLYGRLEDLAEKVLTEPCEFPEPPDPRGVIRFRLASGMPVTVTVRVEPAQS